MNKKILGIVAASLATVGSAIMAAPAHAQVATIDVELEVQPSIYLVTYSKLKFLVNSNDILGANFLNNTAVYDEKAGTTTLPPGELPALGTTLSPITKQITPLYRVFASSGATVRVNASNPTLRRSGTGASPTDTVTMEVADGANKTIAPNLSTFVDGNASLRFTFPGPSAPPVNAMYTGGQLQISVTSP
ncbi:MAG: hypothetical protein IGS39_13080 [Calothrix sp. C42_A2020_038]|nr:hypothetical protein [Calothrix sp. C42_A2020_038]